MDNWNPTSDKEKELKEALIRLKKSTEGVILTPVDQKREEAKEKRFILQGRSYFGAVHIPRLPPHLLSNRLSPSSSTSSQILC